MFVFFLCFGLNILGFCLLDIIMLERVLRFDVFFGFILVVGERFNMWYFWSMFLFFYFVSSCFIDFVL